MSKQHMEATAPTSSKTWQGQPKLSIYEVPIQFLSSFINPVSNAGSHSRNPGGNAHGHDPGRIPLGVHKDSR